jgi:hypothetical protein
MGETLIVLLLVGVIVFVAGHYVGRLGERVRRDRIDEQRRHHWRPRGLMTTYEQDVDAIDRRVAALFRNSR